MKILTSLGIAMLFLCTLGAAHAQIPRTLSYQGALTDVSTGKPRPEGNYTFTFRLYDVASGGTALWTEQKTLPVNNGLFSTALGDQVTFGTAVKFDRQYWLGIQIGNEPELAPRIGLTSVGYSMSSLRADTAMVAMAASADTTWRHDGSNIYRLNGNVGIGRKGSNKKLHVVGGNVQIENLPGEPTAFTVGNDSAGSTYLGIGTSAYSAGHIFLQGISQDGSAWGDIVLNPRGGKIGIGTTNPANNLQVHNPGFSATTRIALTNTVTGDAGDDGLLLETDHLGQALVWNYENTPLYLGTNNTARITVLGNGNVGIGTYDPQYPLDVNGRSRTCVLEITGGCDLAEPFPTSEAESLPAGAVVVIDENNPGHLKLSRQPYDKGVAGIVSGAGGINPGLTLQQEGVMEAGRLVALTGKVYALATAANGPIKPGDLLTTSEVAGHAMKATDRELSHGAVIGKAMSRLEQSEGLVLVLVNLQ